MFTTDENSQIEVLGTETKTQDQDNYKRDITILSNGLCVVKPLNYVEGENDEKYRAICSELVARNIRSKGAMKAFCINMQKQYNVTVSGPILLYFYKIMCAEGVLPYSVRYVRYLRINNVRSFSGVNVFAIFTAPWWTDDNGEYKDEDGIVDEDEFQDRVHTFSCPYSCSFCPESEQIDGRKGEDKRKLYLPKSYLLNEPGVLRAYNNNFHTVNQVRDRACSYVGQGHDLSKGEFITLGGTWSSYPIEYQEMFIRDLYYAANTIFEPYDSLRPKMSMDEEIKANETADFRIIGLSLETRPDKFNIQEALRFRRYGVTRIQFGIQHTDDRVLERVNRKCSTKTMIKAVRLAKDMGFKIIGHLMPDLPQPLLPNIDPNKDRFEKEDIDWSVNMAELDRQMFEDVVSKHELQLDELKIYPLSVLPRTRIEDEYNRGVYVPYGEVEEGHDIRDGPLYQNIRWFQTNCPDSIRIARTIRDIPQQDIQGGNMCTNMNQHLQDEIRDDPNLHSNDIRHCEVRGAEVDYSKVKLLYRQFRSSYEDEYFLKFVDETEEHLLGLLRLRLTHNAGYKVLDSGTRIQGMPDLENCAIIRELHVYGDMTGVGNDGSVNTAQHRGLGKRLLAKAEQLAREAGFAKLAVIAGVGVRNYYRRKGYLDSYGPGNYQIKDLTDPTYATPTITVVPDRDSADLIWEMLDRPYFHPHCDDWCMLVSVAVFVFTISYFMTQ